MRVFSLCVAMAVMGVGCTASNAANDAEVLGTATTPVQSLEVIEEPVVEPVGCEEDPALGIEVDIAASPGLAAWQLSREVFQCADVVTIVEPDATDTLRRAAAKHAISAEGPLLLAERHLRLLVESEIERLDPVEVIWFGSESGRANLETAINQPVALGESELGESELGATSADDVQAALLGQPTIIVPGDNETTLALAPTANAAGVRIFALDPTDPEQLATLPATNEASITIGDSFTPSERWRVEASLAGAALPGGGLDLFPGRRVVAFYGSPVTFRLGLLGERSPERTVERLAPVVESYQLDDVPVYGGFELIATVADRKPGDDGDYSNELTVDELRPWIDVAVQNDLFVVIDLQPGRTDFLTQAKRYEEFLRLPNVGLALDPEWRIGPNERHLVRIGDVKAEEVNQVVDWLTQLVREERSPQKMLVLHQFLERMLPDRHLIRTPPEVAVVIHVDGQGGLFSKYDTYDEMVQAETGPGQTLWWGWKNFLDEDRPVATPEQVHAVDPRPVVVTFQ